MLSLRVLCALAVLGLPPGLSLTGVRLPGQLLPLAGAGSALHLKYGAKSMPRPGVGAGVCITALVLTVLCGACSSWLTKRSLDSF